ncbi:hypothetical protein [Micromonospora craterilacus]|uniref:hypothetical protein n=1 Tax=Micromonospora craterilacus TaxID=1655439 RepID=UPI0011B43141|nr:hypothetical protein [Micromonospora craterilacus]
MTMSKIHGRPRYCSPYRIAGMPYTSDHGVVPDRPGSVMAASSRMSAANDGRGGVQLTKSVLVETHTVRGPAGTFGAE